MYQMLYRTWRPRIFADVIGQSHVVRTLLHQLTSGHVAHAYLFTGSRGTGKTSCAKILAKAVNCLNPAEGDPCNECVMCKGINSGMLMDVTEIDAASNNGVDNIRDLREEAAFTPASAKYRVYIIDEVHMLSTGAFNALLKTLEEPPAHVLFILATTEAHKLPATILSRCQRFDFRRIPVEEIAGRLLGIAEAEGVVLTQGAAMLIARVSDGAMRDALSLLEQCIGAGGAIRPEDGEPLGDEASVIRIDEEVAAQTAGLAGREYLFTLTDAICRQDTGKALGMIDQLHSTSRDFSRVCEELIAHFRNLMLFKTMERPDLLILASKQELEELKPAAARFSLPAILHVLSVLQTGLERMARVQNRRVEFEMMLIRLCSPELDSNQEALIRRIAALEQSVRRGVAEPYLPQEDLEQAEPSAPVRNRAATASVPQEADFQLPQTGAEAEPEHPPVTQRLPQVQTADAKEETEGTPRLMDCWPEVLTELAAIDPPLCGSIAGTQAYIQGGRVLIDAPDPFVLKLINEQVHRKALRTTIFNQTGIWYALGPYQPHQQVSAAKRDPVDEIKARLTESGIPFYEE